MGGVAEPTEVELIKTLEMLRDDAEERGLFVLADTYQESLGGDYVVELLLDDDVWEEIRNMPDHG